jgi:hypothetical protein
LDQETAFLTADGTLRHPGVARHFRDQLALDVVSRLLDQHEASEQIVEAGLAFACEHGKVLTAEAMDDAIASGDFFSGRGAGPGTFLRIAAIGCELTFRDRHTDSSHAL